MIASAQGEAARARRLRRFSTAREPTSDDEGIGPSGCASSPGVCSGLPKSAMGRAGADGLMVERADDAVADEEQGSAVACVLAVDREHPREADLVVEAEGGVEAAADQDAVADAVAGEPEPGQLGEEPAGCEPGQRGGLVAVLAHREQP